MVRSVASELRRLGYQTWLDVECLRPGERWGNAIERAMAASSAMVYCISRLSVESAWTSVELSAARERGLPVVPLLIDDLPIEQLPPALREIQLICAAEWPVVEAPARAAQAIARSVGRPTDGQFAGSAESEVALRVEVKADESGAFTLSWKSALFHSPAAPLLAQSLAELGRASEAAYGVELCIGDSVDPTVAALVLGALSTRPRPARFRIVARRPVLLALATASRCVQVTEVDTETDAPRANAERRSFGTSQCASASSDDA